MEPARELTVREAALLAQIPAEYDGRVWSVDGQPLYSDGPEEGMVKVRENGGRKPLITSCETNLVVKGSGKPVGSGTVAGQAYPRRATRRDLEDCTAGERFERAVRAAFGEYVDVVAVYAG